MVVAKSEKISEEWYGHCSVVSLFGCLLWLPCALIFIGACICRKFLHALHFSANNLEPIKIDFHFSHIRKGYVRTVYLSVLNICELHLNSLIRSNRRVCICGTWTFTWIQQVWQKHRDNQTKTKDKQTEKIGSLTANDRSEVFCLWSAIERNKKKTKCRWNKSETGKRAATAMTAPFVVRFKGYSHRRKWNSHIDGMKFSNYFSVIQLWYWLCASKRDIWPKSTNFIVVHTAL